MVMFFHAVFMCCHDNCYSTIDNSLMSNIQKLFSERIENFSTVEFSKVSVLTGIIKISLKVGTSCLKLISVHTQKFDRANSIFLLRVKANVKVNPELFTFHLLF